MRQGSIRLGRIMGIPLSMDLGVLLVGGLLTWVLATLVLPNGSPGLVSTAYWSVGALGALLFLGSLLAHEMAHSIVARRNDVAVEGITLWMFGGFAQFRSDPQTPGADFRITAAGPATSLGLGALFGAAAWGLATVGAPQLYVSLLGWLGIINAFLGVFNLLPGAPLDGGRILAAALWKVRGDRVAGRIGAATAGKVVGLGLMGLGVVEALTLGGFGGLWTVFIGWFLFSSARAEHAYFSAERAMGDMSVADAMTIDPPRVVSWSSVSELVDGPFRHTQQSAVAVVDGQGRTLGIVTMNDVRRLPAEQWSSTTTAQLMGSGDAMTVVAPDEPLVAVVERLRPAGGGYAVVLDRGELVGLLGPDDIRRAVDLGQMGSRPRRRAHDISVPPPPPVSAPSQRWDPPVTAR